MIVRGILARTPCLSIGIRRIILGTQPDWTQPINVHRPGSWERPVMIAQRVGGHHLNRIRVDHLEKPFQHLCLGL